METKKEPFSARFDDPISKLMFGPKLQQPTEHVQEPEQSDELFTHIDQLIDSAYKLKPLLSPLIDYFFKKK